MVRGHGFCARRWRWRDLDRIAYEQSDNEPGHSVVSRRNGSALMGDVAVPGRQMVAAQYFAGTASLSTSPVLAGQGVRLGRSGRLAIDYSPGWMLDCVAPTDEDTHSCSPEFLRLPAAHSDICAGNGLARLFAGGRSQLSGILPGHSGAKGKRPRCYRDCSPADFTWT